MGLGLVFMICVYPRCGYGACCIVWCRVAIIRWRYEAWFNRFGDLMQAAVHRCIGHVAVACRFEETPLGWAIREGCMLRCYLVEMHVLNQPF